MKRPLFNKKISTSALNLNKKVSKEVEELKQWIENHSRSKLGVEYKVLFYGFEEEEKKRAVSLLAKASKQTVYRVNIKQMLSRYIGETEKNLARVFSQAQKENWILFFDEADALFGKRTNVNDAHDRFANVETTYLLEQFKKYKGLIIVSISNTEKIEKTWLRSFKRSFQFK